jgi:hypothetical protein
VNEPSEDNSAPASLSSGSDRLRCTAAAIGLWFRRHGEDLGWVLLIVAVALGVRLLTLDEIENGGDALNNWYLRIGNLRRPLSSQQCAEWALCQRWRASHRAEAGPMRPIEAAMLTGPARPVGFPAPESSPLRRKYRRSPSGARNRLSRRPARVVTGMTKRSDLEIGLAPGSGDGTPRCRFRQAQRRRKSQRHV